MSVDMVLGVEPDRSDLQIALGDTQGAFHGGQALVGLDGGIRGNLRKTGADDVDAVEAGLPIDLVLSAVPEQGGVGDGDVEVLLDLAAVGVAADPVADPRRPLEGAGADRGGDRLQHPFGGLEQVLALAPAFLGEAWVEAHHEPFSGEVGTGDLGHRIRLQRLR